MSRMHAIPFRLRVVHRRSPNGTAIQDQWRSFRTMAGLIECRAEMLRRPNVHLIETYVLVDETKPGLPQTEPESRTQASHGGDGSRVIVSHANGRDPRKGARSR